MGTPEKSSNGSGFRQNFLSQASLLTLTLTVFTQLFKKRGLAGAFRSCIRALKIFSNLPEHITLQRVMTHPNVVGLTRRHPKLIYRYLWREYLAHGLTKDMRLKIMESHYRYISTHVADDFLCRIFDEDQLLWQDLREGRTLSILLSFPRNNDYEGDLRLSFKIDCIEIYTIIFTIASGLDLNVEYDHFFLITTLQGTAGKAELIKVSTKVCNGVAPPYLLLAATEGIARALGIKAIAGMGIEQQVSNKYEDYPGFLFNYDEFWTDFMGEKSHSMFYLSPVPFPCKPLSQVKSKHRSRTLRSRDYRSRVSEHVNSSFCKDFLSQPISSSPDGL